MEFKEVESYIRTEQKNRNTNIVGVHTCGSRSFTTTRKSVEKITKAPMGTKFYTFAYTLKATRPPLVQQSIADASTEVGGSVGAGDSDGTFGSNGVGGSDGEGGSTLIGADVMEPVWVNERSREHIARVLTLL